MRHAKPNTRDVPWAIGETCTESDFLAPAKRNRGRVQVHVSVLAWTRTMPPAKPRGRRPRRPRRPRRDPRRSRPAKSINHDLQYGAAHSRAVGPSRVDDLGGRDHNTAVKYMCKLQTLEETRIVPGRGARIVAGHGNCRATTLGAHRGCARAQRSGRDAHPLVCVANHVLAQSLATELVDERIIDQWNLQPSTFRFPTRSPRRSPRARG